VYEMNVIPEVLHALKVGRRKVSDGAGDLSNEPQTAVLFSRWTNNAVPRQTSCQGTQFYILPQTTNQMWFCFLAPISTQDGEQCADQRNPSPKFPTNDDSHVS